MRGMALLEFFFPVFTRNLKRYLKGNHETSEIFGPKINSLLKEFLSKTESFVSSRKHIAPAGFWPLGQNPRRHPNKGPPRVYIQGILNKKCVGSMGSFLDLMKLGAHSGLG